MSANALMIDYGFCTGCHACEVACKKHLGLPCLLYTSRCV